MNPSDLMGKAEQAAKSARLLLETDDVDGACNRAYYAMFDAARAALLACGAQPETEIVKTHSGLISTFSLYLVKTGRVPVEFGKALNRAEEIRLAADYRGDRVDPGHAQWVVEQADAFVAAMRRILPQEVGRP
jgi:uncharacterized protein (UPF0332 family)